jgi:hypothetical protein
MENTIKCEYCQKSIGKGYKKRHEQSKACINNRIKNNIYYCKYCDEQFNEFDNIKEHENTCKLKEKYNKLYNKIKLLQNEIEYKNNTINELNKQLLDSNLTTTNNTNNTYNYLIINSGEKIEYDKEDFDRILAILTCIGCDQNNTIGNENDEK